MYYSIVRYVADGTTKIFSVPFDYLEKEFVKVYVDDVEQEITWVSDTQIEFRNPPPAGSIVAIQRETPKYRLVDFKQASILDPETLDRDGNQLAHIVQESLDKSEDALRKDVDDKYDASGKVIKNVARPKDPTDAVNKEYADEIINRASQEANRAKTEADRATTQANLAESAADTAGAHASSAASSANSAAQSASNAAAARDKAELWANAGENVEVEPGKYSAYHWAMRASYSAGESVKAIDGVQGDGGNIDLIAGTGVVITPDPVNKRITIGTNITPELIGAETPAGAQEKADAVQSALDTHKSSGDHDSRYYTKSQLNTSGGGGAVHWDNVTNKPSSFPPSAHTQAASTITYNGSTVEAVLNTLNISRIVEHNLSVENPANGYYVRWENGLQVCFHKLYIEKPDGTKSFLWTYPAAFASSKVVYPMGIVAVLYPYEDDFGRYVKSAVERTLGTRTATQTELYVRFSGEPSSNVEIHAFAIGRWK